METPEIQHVGCNVCNKQNESLVQSYSNSASSSSSSMIWIIVILVILLILGVILMRRNAKKTRK